MLKLLCVLAHLRSTSTAGSYLIYPDLILDPETFANSENPTLRRLSMKPEAMKAFTHRRDSYFDGARRRSTLRRLSSANKVN